MENSQENLLTTISYSDLLLNGEFYANIFTKFDLNFFNLSFFKATFFDKVELEFYPIFSIARQEIICLLTYFKLSSNFNIDSPIDCLALDKIQELFRFTISYILQSSFQNIGLKVVTQTNEVKPLLSTQGIFPAMNWAEREMWDMSGVIILKHPDLRRILTDYGFFGHPLRKDFPLTGFYEVLFDNIALKLLYKISQLSQTSRALVTQSLNWVKPKLYIN